MSITDVRSHLESQKDVIKKFGIKRIGIYGSVARNEDSLDSDIDLLLDFEPGRKTYKNFFNSSMFLESLFSRPVDITTPQAIHPRLRQYIDKDISYVQIAD